MNYVPDDPSIDTYGQDSGYCDICEEHLDSGRCEGHCENETCDHDEHCDICGRGGNRSFVDCDLGICKLCEIEWDASHALPAPKRNDPNANFAMYEQDRVSKIQAQTVNPPMVCKRCGALTPGKDTSNAHRFGTLCEPCEPCLQDTTAIAVQSATFEKILRRFQ